MYTGSGVVGRVVMRAAAEHLTPVILELGGKSPVVVADDADLHRAARRIVWGKYTMNMGQTCVTPDYVLVHRDVKQAFVDAVKAAIAEFYGPDPKSCPDVSRMINERHTVRVASLLKDDRCCGVVVCACVCVRACLRVCACVCLCV
jgi:aldehyde dehydrogenase (NAD+)